MKNIYMPVEPPAISKRKMWMKIFGILLSNVMLLSIGLIGILCHRDDKAYVFVCTGGVIILVVTVYFLVIKIRRVVALAR